VQWEATARHRRGSGGRQSKKSSTLRESKKEAGRTSALPGNVQKVLGAKQSVERGHLERELRVLRGIQEDLLLFLVKTHY